MKNDYQTNTIDGAMAFERMYGERLDFDEVENDCEDFEEDEDYCNCSDPGCPCGGRKYGRL